MPFGLISLEESERKLVQLQQQNEKKLAQIQQENELKLGNVQQELAKLSGRLKKLSVSIENILCKLCGSSSLDIEVWKYINKQLSKEDGQYIVCFKFRALFFFES